MPGGEGRQERRSEAREKNAQVEIFKGFDRVEGRIGILLLIGEGDLVVASLSQEEC